MVCNEDERSLLRIKKGEGGLNTPDASISGDRPETTPSRARNEKFSSTGAAKMETPPQTQLDVSAS